MRGRSVMPVVFWYLSAFGSVLLLLYAVSLPSPVGALSHSINSIVYARNLHFVWQARGQSSRARAVALHALAGAVVVFGVTMLILTWKREMEVAPGSAAGIDPQVLFWIVVGAVGQALFATRFLVQWIATERAGRSIIPSAFWYISVAASSLLIVSHLSRQEWVFVAGLLSTMVVYVRNIMLIRRGTSAVDTSD